MNVAALGEEEAVCRAVDVNAEEVRDCAHVLDSKLGLKTVDELLKKACGRRGEYHVVDCRGVSRVPTAGWRSAPA